MTNSQIAGLVLCCLGMPIVVSAEDAKLNRVVLKQGCALKYPAALEIIDRENVEGIEQNVAMAAMQSPPQFREKVSTATIAFAAVDSRTNPSFRVTLLILPPEVSQKELEEFDSVQQAAIRDALFEQSEPQFEQIGISITKKWPAQVKKGDQLSYFLWAYEFEDGDDVPKISLRSYYYTSSATFLVQVLCTKSKFDQVAKEIGGVLDSLSTQL